MTDTAAADLEDDVVRSRYRIRKLYEAQRIVLSSEIDHTFHDHRAHAVSRKLCSIETYTDAHTLWGMLTSPSTKPLVVTADERRHYSIGRMSAVSSRTFEHRTAARAGFISINAPGGFEAQMPNIVAWFKDKAT